MVILALESSGTEASVGLYKTDSGRAVSLDAQVSTNPKTHSEFLNPAIDLCLKNADLDFSQIDLIAVDIGPGSFTGIRVAVNVARTLSYLLHKPVLGLHSTEILGASVPTKPVLSLINAYKNMYYIGLTSGDGKVTDPTAIAAGDLQKYLDQHGIQKPILALGDGYIAYKHLLSEQTRALLLRDPKISDAVQNQALADLALQKSANATIDWKLIIPLYIRASAAEENKVKN